MTDRRSAAGHRGGSGPVFRPAWRYGLSLMIVVAIDIYRTVLGIAPDPPEGGAVTRHAFGAAGRRLPTSPWSAANLLDSPETSRAAWMWITGLVIEHRQSSGVGEAGARWRRIASSAPTNRRGTKLTR